MTLVFAARSSVDIGASHWSITSEKKPFLGEPELIYLLGAPSS